MWSIIVFEFPVILVGIFPMDKNALRIREFEYSDTLVALDRRLMNCFL